MTSPADVVRFHAEFDYHPDDLVASKRRSASGRTDTKPSIVFHHADYTHDLPIEDRSIDLLVLLYAGFIGEHCSRYLRPGGLLLANNSHGDTSMATLDERFELAAVVTASDGSYQVRTDALDRYLQPIRGDTPTWEGLHATNRGIAYTTSPFAYIFRFD